MKAEEDGDGPRRRAVHDDYAERLRERNRSVAAWLYVVLDFGFQ